MMILQMDDDPMRMINIYFFDKRIENKAMKSALLSIAVKISGYMIKQ